MENFRTSLIRTVVPVIVGIIITTVAKLNVEIDSGAVTDLVTAVVTGAYYAAVRWAESRWPQAGWLLGSPHAPEYDKGGN